MIVVSDTSPIANLARIGRLDLLREVYGHVPIPEAVYAEISAAPFRLESDAGAPTGSWLEIRNVTNLSLIATVQLELDRGEAEAIALASELPQSLSLIDERKGRTVAARLGLTFVGLLGVLIEAKRRGLLPAIRPLLDALTADAGFWLHPELRERVLLAAGE